MTQKNDALPWAERYHQLGYTVIPLKVDTKQAAIKWKKYQLGESRLSNNQLQRWFSNTDHNIAIVPTGNIVVVDCDSPELVELVLTEAGITPMMCTTPHGGVHCYYRARKGVKVTNQVKVKGKLIDLRCQGGYAVVPPSQVNGVPYSWINDNVASANDLPVFKISWTRKRKRPAPTKVIRHPDEDDNVMIARARCYVANIEGAVEGKGGSNQTFRVACVLTQKFGLTFDQAWPILLEWNRTCEPPWTEKELRHKLLGALRRSRR